MSAQASSGARETFRASLGLLATRRFGTFWIASLLSSIGTWAQQVAEPWLLLSLGSSPLILGLDSFAMNAPVLVLTLIGGMLADRSDRRRVILLFQSIQMACPTLIVVLLAGGTISPWTIVALSLVVGVTDALSMPSFQSIVPSIVEPEQIGTGIALNATQFSLSRILGPALAGVLMASTGAIGCFAVSALSYLPLILVALWILPRRAAASPDAGGARRPYSLADVAEIVRSPDLRAALVTVLISSACCGPLVTFAPVLVKEALHADVREFSGVLAAFGAGGILGASGLLAVPPGTDQRLLSARVAAAYGAVVVLAALAPRPSVLGAVLVGAGAAMTVSNAAANTLLQTVAGPRLRGQAASLYMLAIRGGRSVGDLATGVSVVTLGVREALLLNGALALLLHLALGRRTRAHRIRLESPQTAD